MTKPRILIGVPAYGGSIKNGCVESLLGIKDFLASLSIAAYVNILDVTNIAFARNVFASRAVAGDFSHLLMIDTDMSCQPALIGRMLDADKDVIGAVYRSRSEQEQYVISPLARFDIKNGVFPVNSIGAGILLIKHSALVLLLPHVASGKDERVTDKTVSGFFTPIEIDGIQRGEDVSFCARWRNIGGEVFAIADPTVGHIGQTTFRGDFIKHVKSL